MADDPFAALAAVLDRLTTLQAMANGRLEFQEVTLRVVVQCLDRQDATQAGMSRTFVRLTTVLDQQTQVLDRLQQTLERLLPQGDNGREA
jgi:site-specific recombinase